jgi:hypothetical protein
MVASVALDESAAGGAAAPAVVRSAGALRARRPDPQPRSVDAAVGGAAGASATTELGPAHRVPTAVAGPTLRHAISAGWASTTSSTTADALRGRGEGRCTTPEVVGNGLLLLEETGSRLQLALPL